MIKAQSMTNRMILAVVLVMVCTYSAPAEYQALDCLSASSRSTWAILEKNGANAAVKPYLSSLANGETGVGVISSPEFVIAGDSITFTITGHDGPTGGRGENYIVLIDAATGKTLIKTEAPHSDAMQNRSWDVGKLKNARVRIEIRDGNSNSGFAWLGIGRIDASDALKVDFSKGMPDDWTWPEQKTKSHYEILKGPPPFRTNPAASSIIPPSGSAEFPCGFAAERLFFLGCTVTKGKPLATYGGIEIHYRTGSPDVFVLMQGFTLQDIEDPVKATHLRASPDSSRRYMVIAPRAEVIEKIRLVAGPQRGPIPRITAITCQTSAKNDNLTPLPKTDLSTTHTAWIKSHEISADSPKLATTVQTLRKAYKKPAIGAATTVAFQKHKLDGEFRAEGVAVADFNGDGKLDIAAGNVYYAAPYWKIVPMFGKPKHFNRNGYSDAFLCFDDDINADGATDLIVVGFPGQQTHWLENPGQTGEQWKKHLAVSRTGNESPAYTDIDGDGRRELIFMDAGKCVLARPGQDPKKPWPIQPISKAGEPTPGHGLGIGDIDSDGRLDIVIPNGWWRQPKDPKQTPWKFHKAEIFGGAQLCVADFDGDGDSDVLGSSAHGYGISWSQQSPEGWRTHEIDSTYSQTHALHLADINGDGLTDFVTGKRFWAHNGHDPGSFQPSVLCWYEQIRNAGKTKWIKRIIDFESGVGLHFQIVDINRDGMLDIVTANKKGVYYFEQIRKKTTDPTQSQ